MGFKEQDAKRALRICSQDVGSAIDFLVEEKAKRAKEREDNEQRRKEIMLLPLSPLSFLVNYN